MYEEKTLIPAVLLVILVTVCFASASFSEYNTTFPVLFHSTLQEGVKQTDHTFARHRVISTDIDGYICWIDYAPADTNNFTPCTDNFICYIGLPSIPPEYQTIPYLATPATGSRMRLRTETFAGIFTKWVHGEILY